MAVVPTHPNQLAVDHVVHLDLRVPPSNAQVRDFGFGVLGPGAAAVQCLLLLRGSEAGLDGRGEGPGRTSSSRMSCTSSYTGFALLESR